VDSAPRGTAVADNRGVARISPGVALGASTTGSDVARDDGDEGPGAEVATGTVVGADTGEFPAQATSKIEATVNTTPTEIFRCLLSAILRSSSGSCVLSRSPRAARQPHNSIHPTRARGKRYSKSRRSRRLRRTHLHTFPIGRWHGSDVSSSRQSGAVCNMLNCAGRRGNGPVADGSSNVRESGIVG